ncbi:MAG TPA: hypothetical protein VF610_00055 [Segetibacter sp.]|jgi:hypothetical protein
MKVSELKAYEVFKTKFGEKDAEIVFEFFEASKTESVTGKQVDERLKDFKDIFATKEDLARVIGDTKSELLKWMFIFWTTQLLAMFAFLKFFIK